jgi:hypothetical protein
MSLSILVFALMKLYTHVVGGGGGGGSSGGVLLFKATAVVSDVPFPHL